jgi:hypothetical protein
MGDASATLPNLAWAGAELLGADLDERFEAALDLIIAGLEAWLT